MRRRIKQELKTSIAEHGEYRNVLTRLQKSYERKCEDVRNQQVHESLNSQPITSHHEAERQASGSTQGSTDTSPPQSPSSSALSHPTGPHIITGATSSTPNAAAPPSASGRAQDALKASRTQINSLIQRIGGNPDVPVGKSAGAALGGVKGFKAKREAEEADKEYRRGVFHMETLRLQRERVGRSALASAEEFAFDLSSTMKREVWTAIGLFYRLIRIMIDMLCAYGDIGVFTNGATQAALEHASLTAREISPELDVTNYSACLPFDINAEPRIYYENCCGCPCLGHMSSRS